jgi:hypothetical protein
MDRLAHSVLSPRSDNATPTGREGNVAPAVHPIYRFGSQPQNNNQNNSGNSHGAVG